VVFARDRRSTMFATFAQEMVILAWIARVFRTVRPYMISVMFAVEMVSLAWIV